MSETIQDIIAEMRQCAEQLHPRAKYIPTLSIRAWRRLCDRIEAATAPQGNAAKCARCRENGLEDGEECEYYGEPAGCNSPIYGHHPAEQCNAAALREALEDFTDHIWYLYGGPEGANGGGMHSVADLLEEARAALAAPPRNCDRSDIRTPWDAVMAWADATDPEYAAIVREHEDEWEPARYQWEQIVGWLLAPAEEGGEK